MKTVISLCVVLVVVLLTYSNHFENSFHFDDAHAIVENPYIRDLGNIGVFFTDAQAFSTLPANRTYRPFVSLSLAIDYWMGQGLTPFYFHVSTFLWFLVQLLLMYALFRKISDIARPDPRNQWFALFAIALYGLHPVMAETVNYVIQRGDILSTAGVIASLAFYIYAPGMRKFGVYLLPFAVAVLTKPPAMVFPLILLIYIWLFENESLSRALRKSVPALVTAALLAYLTVAMTPASLNPGASSASAYRITQPSVALTYFQAFFVPNHLSADTDRQPLSSILQDDAWTGFLFVLAVIAAALWASKKREWRPVAFGLWWFLLALVPTSVFPLAEVENDHRMFFPFAGLVLAVCWPVAQWIFRQRLQGAMRVAVAAGCVAVLAGYAWGTRMRNEVWRTDESLWLDVTVKSPKNGRGLMNYGLTQMSKGDYRTAHDYFTRAAVLSPNYYVLDINLGISSGGLNDDTAAERHFNRALELAPRDAGAHYYYARWLEQKARWPEAVEHLKAAIDVNPDYMPARYLMMEGSAKRGEWQAVQTLAEATLERFPSDQAAANHRALAASPNRLTAPQLTPEQYLNLSLSYHRAGKFNECIAAAKEALKLRPNYAEAYNNIAAAYEALEMWEPAIEAAQQALKIRPDFPLARNNLAWSMEQKKKQEEAK